MRPCDKEDLRQEKLLAELEGKAFSFSVFRTKYAPSQEVSTEDPELAARIPQCWESSFQSSGAEERDEKLKAKVAAWCFAGASQRWIACELSRLRVPKFGPRKVGKPWTSVGVLHMLRRMELKTKASTWTHWRTRAKQLATTASSARRGLRRFG